MSVTSPVEKSVNATTTANAKVKKDFMESGEGGGGFVFGTVKDESVVAG